MGRGLGRVYSPSNNVARVHLPQGLGSNLVRDLGHALETGSVLVQLQYGTVLRRIVGQNSSPKTIPQSNSTQQH